MKKFDSTDDAQTPLFHYHWTLVPRPIPSSLGGFMGYVTNAPDVGKTHDGAQDEEKDNTKPEGNSPDNRSEARRKSREAFANKHLIVDFPDMARNFSDEQISEILFFIEKGGTVYFSRFDPVDSKGLGRFFLDLKSKEEFRDRIVMHRLNLEQLAADHLQGFEGEIFYLASKVSPLNREALKSKLNRVGIRENRIIPLAYRDQTGGTLGVGIKNKAGLLKNQLPDYVQVDSKGRFTIDPSETLFWQGLYHEAFAFAQSA